MKLPKELTGDGLYVNAKAGVYAIVNPAGEIYIGQSINIPDRIRDHKKFGGRSTKLLKYSMFNHGRKNHKYYLVLELEENASQEVLQEWEKFYIQKFTDEGYKMLNGNNGGSGGKKGSFGSTGRKITHQLNYDRYNQPL